MPNPTITSLDVGSGIVGTPDVQDAVINFAGADVLKPLTLLARHTGTLKLQIYVKGGVSNGNGVPVALTLGEVVATGVGDVPVRAIFGGSVVQERLVIDAQGDGSAVDATVLDLLRSTGIRPVPTQQLSKLDNS